MIDDNGVMRDDDVCLEVTVDLKLKAPARALGTD